MPLKDLPPDARPREKLLARGPGALSDAELLALLLRTGIVGKGVLTLAQELLDTFGGIAGLGLLLIGLAPSPGAVVTGYLLQTAVSFAAGGLVIASWPDALPVRQLAVGSGAINTLWQLGSFLSPYAFGAMRDATGSYHAGLLGSAALALIYAGYVLYVRARIRRM